MKSIRRLAKTNPEINLTNVLKAVYTQSRINEERACTRRVVSIVASRKYANILHSAIGRAMRSACSPLCPPAGLVKWSETSYRAVGMDCRWYEPGILTFPIGVALEVLIPKQAMQCFMVPDYDGGHYFDLITNRWQPFPQSSIPKPTRQLLKHHNSECARAAVKK